MDCGLIFEKDRTFREPIITRGIVTALCGRFGTEVGRIKVRDLFRDWDFEREQRGGRAICCCWQVHTRTLLYGGIPDTRALEQRHTLGTGLETEAEDRGLINLYQT